MKLQFKVTPFEAKTLVWWKNRRSQIDMNPPYQRHGRLWSDSDKSYLIDSIINGFDVPKLYMADFTWGDSALNRSKLPYAIIDGKQRLEAIFDFFDGNIVLNDDFVYLKNESIKINGLGYQDLRKNHPDIAEEFDNYNLSIMSVVSEKEDFINDLFVRLNRSKPLTGAEIRNAMTGPAVDVIRQISRHEFFTVNIRFSVERMTDQDTAAKILMFEYYGKPLETKRRNLDDFVSSTAKDKKDRLELAGRRSLEVLDDMATIFLPKDKLLTSAGVVPVYYWLVRSLDKNEFPKLREFLVRIEEERKETLKLVANDPRSDNIDQELVQVNNYYRSPNDASSHEGRFKIMQRRFVREYRLDKNLRDFSKPLITNSKDSSLDNICEFLKYKNPKNKVEQFAVIARFRELKEGVISSTRDDFEAISKSCDIDFERDKFSDDMKHGREAGLFSLAGSMSNGFPLSAFGQKYVDLLPDRDSIKALRKSRK